MKLKEWCDLQSKIFKELGVSSEDFHTIKILSSGLRPYRDFECNDKTYNKCLAMARRVLKTLNLS